MAAKREKVIKFTVIPSETQLQKCSIVVVFFCFFNVTNVYQLKMKTFARFTYIFWKQVLSQSVKSVNVYQ